MQTSFANQPFGLNSYLTCTVELTTREADTKINDQVDIPRNNDIEMTRCHLARDRGQSPGRCVWSRRERRGRAFSTRSSTLGGCARWARGAPRRRRLRRQATASVTIKSRLGLGGRVRAIAASVRGAVAIRAHAAAIADLPALSPDKNDRGIHAGLIVNVAPRAKRAVTVRGSFSFFDGHAARPRAA